MHKKSNPQRCPKQIFVVWFSSLWRFWRQEALHSSLQVSCNGLSVTLKWRRFWVVQSWWFEVERVAEPTTRGCRGWGHRSLFIIRGVGYRFLYSIQCDLQTDLEIVFKAAIHDKLGKAWFKANLDSSWCMLMSTPLSGHYQAGSVRATDPERTLQSAAGAKNFGKVSSLKGSKRRTCSKNWCFFWCSLWLLSLTSAGW